MPLGIETIRVDIRTGRLSENPESSLPVTVRGTNPRVRPGTITPDVGKREETGLTEPVKPEERPGQAGQAGQAEQGGPGGPAEQ
jgi:hypothetical protein